MTETCVDWIKSLANDPGIMVSWCITHDRPKQICSLLTENEELKGRINELEKGIVDLDYRATVAEQEADLATGRAEIAERSLASANVTLFEWRERVRTAEAKLTDIKARRNPEAPQ